MKTSASSMTGTAPSNRPLNGQTLLLVEDDGLVAMELDELIRDLGGEVVGPFGRLNRALDAIRQKSITGAVLDIRLDSETTFPIIDLLLERACPILLVTGGAAESFPEKYRHLPRLRKPFGEAEFQQRAIGIFSSR
jgi:DNA-binding response OmpR family regulator